MGVESRAGFQTVNSQLTNVESFNRASHQAVLGLLKGRAQSEDRNVQTLNELLQQQTKATDVSEVGFRAVSAELGQIGGQLQEIKREQIAFGKMRKDTPLFSTQFGGSNVTVSEATVFWRRDLYNFPIGALQISMKQVRRNRHSKRWDSQDCTESIIDVTFAPPRWLSSFAIKYTVKLSCDLTASQWQWGAKLKPLTINHNPLFIEAVERCDVEGVRKCFREGIAHPTDYISDGWRLVPWSSVIIPENPQSRHTNPILQEIWYHCSNKNTIKARLHMVEFMIKEGVPSQ